MKPAASFITVTSGSDVWWRAEAPARVLGARVVKIPADEVTETLTYPNTSTRLPWRFRVIEENGNGTLIRSEFGWRRFTSVPRRLVSLTAEFPTLTGEPVVFGRPCRAREALARAMRHQGILTVAETDDNYFAPPEQNIFAYEQRADVERLHALHAVALASMERIVFSTAWLRDRYHREFRARFKTKGMPEKAWLPDMFICRNHLPDWAWPEVAEYDGPKRVGFMGSPSHVFDMAALGYASFHAAKHLGATTTCIGYSPADPDPDIPDEITVDGEVIATRSEKSLLMSRTWAKVVDNHVRWIDPGLYHKRASIPLDIGIAPLLQTEFNYGKSDIKMIEYASNGALPIGSRNQVYTRAGWVHGENCLLGSSQEDLAAQVVRALKDPRMCAELVANAQAMIREKRGEDAMREEWGAALS